MGALHKDLEHQVLRIVVNGLSKLELEKMSLNLHKELIRVCQILKRLLDAKQINSNGLLCPISDLLISRKSYKQKSKLVQQICWQYVEISTTIDWICEHNQWGSIPVTPIEKLPDVLASFYQQKIPAMLGANRFRLLVNQYNQMTTIEIVDSLTIEHEKLSKRIHAFHCLHTRIIGKKSVRTRTD